MQPISGLATGAAQLPAAVKDVKEAPEVQRPGGEKQGRPVKSVMDEYIPEAKQEPSGRYWLGKDADGQPKIYFDDPERAADASERAESCTCNTDKVDREIEGLKKKQEELKRQLDFETDDTKVKELEQELAQVERELRQKDNDAYRRQHAAFS